MPKYQITSPDGQSYEVNAPEGATESDAIDYVQKNLYKPTTDTGFAQGLIHGATLPVKTLINLGADLGGGIVDKAVGLFNPELVEMNKRTAPPDARALLNAKLDQIHKEQSQKTGYGAGDLIGQIGSTWGVGGALAKPLANVAPMLSNSIASGGMTLGGTTGNAVLNGAARALGGAVTSGVSGGLLGVDPIKSAELGAAIPVGSVILNKAGSAIGNGLDNASHSLMQSALKPTIKQLKTGDAKTAVQTLLDLGISPTASGVNKIKSMIGDINNEISTKISGSTATIPKQDVLQTLNDVKSKFSNQVSPTSDLNAIQGIADDFSTHPSIIGNEIPVQQAQALKQGTYKVLKGKYGEVGSASTEAQKAMARGLKEGIANAVPDVAGLNAQESKLLTTLSVAERRALMDANKNPMGLAALANNPVTWAMFMADRSAAFKGLAARMVNNVATQPKLAGLLDNVTPLLSKATPALLAQ
jgi:hypothetical protein